MVEELEWMKSLFLSTQACGSSRHILMTAERAMDELFVPCHAMPPHQQQSHNIFTQHTHEHACKQASLKPTVLAGSSSSSSSLSHTREKLQIMRLIEH